MVNERNGSLENGRSFSSRGWKSAAAGFLHEGEFSRASVSSCTGVSKTGSSWVDSVEKQTRRGACIDRVHEDDDHAPSTGGLKKFASPLPIGENLIQPIENMCSIFFSVKFQILFNLRVLFNLSRDGFWFLTLRIARISSSDETLGFLWVAKGSWNPPLRQ